MYRRKRTKETYNTSKSEKNFPICLLVISILIIIIVGYVLYKNIGTKAIAHSNFGYKFY